MLWGFGTCRGWMIPSVFLALVFLGFAQRRAIDKTSFILHDGDFGRVPRTIHAQQPRIVVRGRW